MIERFDRHRFEDALPKIPWNWLGLVHGEHCYSIPVKDGIGIFIRSSISKHDVAAETGKDSIRCWLVKAGTESGLGSKDVRWIARTKGWDARLLETLRALWRVGSKLDKCPYCQSQQIAIKVKHGKNEGRWMSKCPSCVLPKGFGRWITPQNNPVELPQFPDEKPSYGAIQSALHDFDPRDDYRK